MPETNSELLGAMSGSSDELNLAPILDRLGVDRSNWVHTGRKGGRMFKQAAGRASALEQHKQRILERHRQIFILYLLLKWA
jgi:hypothetical protein